MLAIVFVESGLLVGFFLPGDSLLFTAGLLSSNGTLPDLWILLVTIPLAAIAGDQVGYAIGRKAGPEDLQPARGPPLPARVRREVGAVLREARRAHDRACAVRPDRPDVRAGHGRGGADALPHVRHLQRDRRRRLGVRRDPLGYFLGQIEFVRLNIEYIIVAIVLISSCRSRSRSTARSAHDVTVTATAWIATVGGILALLALDFLVSARRPHEVGFREAVGWSVFYIGVAIAFGIASARSPAGTTGPSTSPATSSRRACRSTTSSSS